MHVLADSSSTTGWAIGYTIAIVVVVVVVALVVPILLLAHAIGKQAAQINDGLTEAVRQHRRAQGAEHHDRSRRGHRRRPQPGPQPAGRLTMTVACADLDAAEPVVGRDHRRLRRRARRRRAAHDPRRCWCARSTGGSS